MIVCFTIYDNLYVLVIVLLLPLTLCLIYTAFPRVCRGRVKIGTANMRAALNFENATGGTKKGQALNAYSFAAQRFMERRKHNVEGTPMYHIFGFVEWVFLAMAATAW